MCAEPKNSKPQNSSIEHTVEHDADVEENEAIVDHNLEEKSKQAAKEKNKTRKPDGSDAGTTAKTTLCKFYIYKSCRHGVNGNGCAFAHPKKCFRYARDGMHKKRGCTKGKDCTFFHPPLCKSALRDGVCNRQDCKFHHIRGTKFRHDRDEFNEITNSTPAQHNNQVAKSKPILKAGVARRVLPERPTYANVVSPDRGHGDPMAVSNQRGPPESYQMNRENESSNFIELRNQIQQMQLKLETILRKNFSPQTVTGGCHCQTMCH